MKVMTTDIESFTKQVNDTIGYYVNQSEKADPRAKGFVHIANATQLYKDIASAVYKADPAKYMENDIEKAANRLFNDVMAMLAKIQFWNGGFRTVNRGQANETTVPQTASINLGTWSEIRRDVYSVVALDYRFIPAKKPVTHPDAVKFVKTCTKLFPAAANVAKFAEAIRSVISNTIACGGGDAAYTQRLCWLYSATQGGNGKSTFLSALHKVFRERFGFKTRTMEFEVERKNPADYDGQLVEWSDVGEMRDCAKEKINNLIDHTETGFDIKYGAKGSFKAHCAFVASSNYFPAGIQANGRRYFVAEYIPTLCYTNRPADLKEKYWPKAEDMEQLVFDLIDSCPLVQNASDIMFDADSLAKYEESLKHGLLGTNNRDGKHTVPSQFTTIAMLLAERVEGDIRFKDKNVRICEVFADVDDRVERKQYMSAAVRLVNHAISTWGVYKPGAQNPLYRKFNLSKLIDAMDMSYVDSEVATEEEYVREQWNLLLGMVAQNTPTTPTTPPEKPHKREEKDEGSSTSETKETTTEPSEGLVNDSTASEDPLDIILNSLDGATVTETTEPVEPVETVKVETVEPVETESYSEKVNLVHEAQSRFESTAWNTQGDLSDICVGYGFQPVKDRFAQPKQLDKTDPDRYVSSPREEYVAAVEYMGEGTPTRLQKDCRPTAFVYEADASTVKAQLENLRDGADRHMIWATFSGSKSVHFVCPIPKELRDSLNDRDVYKAVWRKVAEKLFKDASILDTACASIGRLTRMPGAMNSKTNKPQIPLFINFEVEPVEGFKELVDEAVKARDEERRAVAVRSAVNAANAARFANRENCEQTYDTELKHLEHSIRVSDSEVKRLALDSLKAGAVPAGSNMVGALRLLVERFPLLAEPFYELCHEQHPSNVGQPFEYYAR